MPSTQRLTRGRLRSVWFALWVLSCVVGGSLLAARVATQLPLISDEFDGAYDAYRLARDIPYRDFRPYKTVLGYYLELPPLLLSSDVYAGLLNVKLSLVVLNGALCALTAFWVARLLSPVAAALALPLWLLMTEWVERAAELRVDTLTAWAGLFSLLSLLSGRFALAGVCAALSFLISQKGVYYMGSAVAALAVAALLELTRGAGARWRGALRPALRFGGAYALTLAPYFAVTALLSSTQKIVQTTFLSHHAIAFTTLYPHIRRFWGDTLERNPAFYALAALGLLLTGVAAAFDSRASRRGAGDRPLRSWMLFVYGLVLSAGCAWHKQPWPYFFVILIPTAYVLCAAAVQLLWPWPAPERDVAPVVARRPARSALARWSRAALVALLLVVGTARPLSHVPEVLREDNGYQRHMVELASRLVRPGEHYLAAFDVLYNREQSSRRLARLSIPRRRQLEHAPAEKAAALLEEVRQKPPKLLLENGRFVSLPRALKRWLRDNYAPYWGSIRLYAPRVRAGTRVLSLAFGGRYRVELPAGREARIDGHELSAGEVLELAAGPHRVEAPAALRLRLHVPEVDALRKPAYRRRRPLSGNAYNR